MPDGGSDIDKVIDKIMSNVRSMEEDHEDDNYDCYDDFILESMNKGTDGKKIAYSPCDSCGRKKVIIHNYKRVANREYIPPYIDPDVRDFKIALIIERIDSDTVEKIFKYLLFRVSIRDILDKIDDPEWRKQAEAIIRTSGYSAFIDKNFGKLNKKQIIQLLFDVNFCYFNDYDKRNINNSECEEMLKYYIVLVLRGSIKESLLKIVKTIELELEYKIAVIEGEIRYIIKCILQEIVVAPFPTNNLSVEDFNKIGSLTEVLKVLDGVIINGNTAALGKHDERSDFRHIRDTIRKYEKTVRTSFDLLNKKISQYEHLLGQRKYIVGVTGICEKASDVRIDDEGTPPVVVPPIPLVVLNPPNK